MTVKIFLIVISLFGLNVSADIVGQAKVTDGDTIIIDDIRIRFTGSDAPESYFFGKKFYIKVNFLILQTVF